MRLRRPNRSRRAIARSLLPTCALAWTAAVPVPATAQQAADPWAAGCLLHGLDAEGDGYLSIRSGPGADQPEIARVVNGDALYLDTRACQGDWCFAHGGSVSGQETDLQGWFHTGWCEFYP